MWLCVAFNWLPNLMHVRWCLIDWLLLLLLLLLLFWASPYWYWAPAFHVQWLKHPRCACSLRSRCLAAHVANDSLTFLGQFAVYCCVARLCTVVRHRFCEFRWIFLRYDVYRIDDCVLLTQPAYASKLLSCAHKLWSETELCAGRGVARNLLRGGASLGDGSPPAGSRGRAPVGVWGRSPQKPEKNANFQLRRRNVHPCPPWLRHWSPPKSTSSKFVTHTANIL